MKKNIALLFGGKSPEHEVSIWSAKNIYAAMDKEKYDILLIGIGRNGAWRLLSEADLMQESPLIELLGEPLVLMPGSESSPLYLAGKNEALPRPDAVFPIIHGPNGEDGTLQGLLMQLDLPFVGPGVLGSAVAMDKDVCKRLFLEAGLKTAAYLLFHKQEAGAADYQYVVNKLGSPVFVKPANMGSSVGVSKASNESEFHAALELAFRFDTKVLVEEAICGRELECAVLGNELPQASGVGEVIVTKGFYDYETKYLNDDARIVIPAENLSEEQLDMIRTVARQAFQVLGCEGMSRVDVFLTAQEDVYVNEVNTLPGFTKISMYPKLWAQAGLPYVELIDSLLQFAIDRKARENSLQRARLL